jgi:hypothetical protein
MRPTNGCGCLLNIMLRITVDGLIEPYKPPTSLIVQIYSLRPLYENLSESMLKRLTSYDWQSAPIKAMLSSANDVTVLIHDDSTLEG